MASTGRSRRQTRTAIQHRQAQQQPARAPAPAAPEVRMPQPTQRPTHDGPPGGLTRLQYLALRLLEAAARQEGTAALTMDAATAAVAAARVIEQAR